MSSPSQTWDFQRFLKTLCFFNPIPVVSQIKTMFIGSSSPPPPTPQNNILYDFRHSESDLLTIWGSLDDVVMGGVSQSQVKTHPEGLLFTGEVSTQNSGGFASIRTQNFSQPLNLSHCQGLSLTIKGDGQRYKFFVRDSTVWDSKAYATSFDTVPNEWITVNVPFESLEPVMRAKIVQDAPPLDTNAIASFQLMLSKFEYNGQLNPHFSSGQFELIVQSIALLP